MLMLWGLSLIRSRLESCGLRRECVFILQITYVGLLRVLTYCPKINASNPFRIHVSTCHKCVLEMRRIHQQFSPQCLKRFVHLQELICGQCDDDRYILHLKRRLHHLLNLPAFPICFSARSVSQYPRVLQSPLQVCFHGGDAHRGKPLGNEDEEEDELTSPVRLFQGRDSAMLLSLEDPCLTREANILRFNVCNGFDSFHPAVLSRRA
jgi:hypothetical protein